MRGILKLKVGNFKSFKIVTLGVHLFQEVITYNVPLLSTSIPATYNTIFF